MSAELSVKDLLERNKQLVPTHKPAAHLSEMGALGISPPHLLVITCVDTRCEPHEFLGLELGEAICIRNIGGRVVLNIIDVVAADNLIGLNEIMIVHHTDCGSCHFKDDDLRRILKERCPTMASIDSMEFGAITNLEQSVRDDVAFLKGSPFMRKELAEHVYGFVLDIKTGVLTPVDG